MKDGFHEIQLVLHHHQEIRLAFFHILIYGLQNAFSMEALKAVCFILFQDLLDQFIDLRMFPLFRFTLVGDMYKMNRGIKGPGISDHIAYVTLVVKQPFQIRGKYNIPDGPEFALMGKNQQGSPVFLKILSRIIFNCLLLKSL